MKPSDHIKRIAVSNAISSHQQILFAGMPREIGRRKVVAQKERVRTVVDDILFEFLKQKPRMAA